MVELIKEGEGANMNSQYSQLFNNQSNLDKYGSVIKDLTDPSHVLPHIEMDLRRQREVLNKETGETSFIQIETPLMNEKGITNVMSVCRASINNIAVLNNLPRGMIENTMMRMIDDLILDLMLSLDEYDIKNSKDRDLITSIVTIPIWLTLLRGQEGGERKFWGSHPSFNEPQNNKSFWNPFRRGG